MIDNSPMPGESTKDIESRSRQAIGTATKRNKALESGDNVLRATLCKFLMDACRLVRDESRDRGLRPGVLFEMDLERRAHAHLLHAERRVFEAPHGGTYYSGLKPETDLFVYDGPQFLQIEAKDLSCGVSRAIVHDFWARAIDLHAGRLCESYQDLRADHFVILVVTSKVTESLRIACLRYSIVLLEPNLFPFALFVPYLGQLERMLNLTRCRLEDVKWASQPFNTSYPGGAFGLVHALRPHARSPSVNCAAPFPRGGHPRTPTTWGCSMSRTKLFIRQRWHVTRNPFPQEAIATDGQASRIFLRDLHPGLDRRMASVFLGSRRRVPRVAYLWSLGEGDGARGFGKTEHLLWFTDLINKDCGRSAFRLAGLPSRSALAAYAAFNTIDGLSLSNLLFDLTVDLLVNRGAALARAIERREAKGLNRSDLFRAASIRLQDSGDEWDRELLSVLCHEPPSAWAWHINDRETFKEWHRVRWGARLIRTCVAFITAVGINRLIAMVDQVEDFANADTPRYKLRRDLPRLGDLLAFDPVMNGKTTFVLTLHPGAAREADLYWPGAAIGAVHGPAQDRKIILIEGMKPSSFLKLVEHYLGSVRIKASRRLR